MNARFVGDRCAEERERERMTSFFALLALGSHECACPHIGEKERENCFLGNLDQKTKEEMRENTPKRVCVLWEGIKLAWNEDCVGIRLRGPMSRTRGAIGARESEHRITRPRFHSPSTAGAFTTSYGFRLYRSGTKGAISTPPRRPSNKPDQLGAR